MIVPHAISSNPVRYTQKGYQADDYRGLYHFWATFVGVNLTFFPIHFMGTGGIPRRVPDYPVAYFYWNAISSVGSLISAAAALYFFYLVYSHLTDGIFVRHNYNQ